MLQGSPPAVIKRIFVTTENLVETTLYPERISPSFIFNTIESCAILTILVDAPVVPQVDIVFLSRDAFWKKSTILACNGFKL